MDPMTDPQADYIERNRKRLRIDRAVLDRWAQERYGVPIAKLDKAQASDCLDRLIVGEPCHVCGYHPRQGPKPQPIAIETERFSVKVAYQAHTKLSHVIYRVRDSVEMTACTFDPAQRRALMAALAEHDRFEAGPPDSHTVPGSDVITPDDRATIGKVNRLLDLHRWLQSTTTTDDEQAIIEAHRTAYNAITADDYARMERLAASETS